MTEIGANVLAVCLVTLLGFALGRSGMLGRAFSGEGSRLVIYVFTPSLILHSFITRFRPEDLLVYLRLPVVGMLTVLAGYGVSRLVARAMRWDADKAKTFVFMNTVTNYSFLPITIVFLLLGDAGLLLLFIHNIGCSLVHWTLGIRELSGPSGNGRSRWRDLLTPGVSAIGLGMALACCNAWIPESVVSALQLVGQATIPIALLVVGGMIAQTHVAVREDLPAVGLLVALRLVGVPLLAVGIISLFGLPDLARRVAVIVALMPTASTAPVFVKQYGGCVPLAAKGFLATTLASILTVPLLYALFAR